MHEIPPSPKSLAPCRAGASARHTYDMNGRISHSGASVDEIGPASALAYAVPKSLSVNASRAKALGVVPSSFAARSIAAFIPTGIFTEKVTVPSCESGGLPWTTPPTGCIPTINHFFGDFLTVRRVVLLLNHLVLLSVSRISFANFFWTGVLA